MDAHIDTDMPLLQMRGVRVAQDGHTLLDGLDLELAQGQHCAILGPNGSGKSTLVRLLERRLYPRADGDGEVRIRMFGRERWRVEELRRLLGVVSAQVQHEFAAEPGLSAQEAVLSGFFAARGLADHHVVDAGMRERAGEALQRMDGGHLAARRVETLSSGEARRVLIARALVHRPRALLLDEPCAGLDMVSRRQFLEALRGLATDGTTVLMVTHHVEEILPEMRHVVLLRDGRLQAQGSTRELLTDAVLSDLFGRPLQVQRHGDWYTAALR